MTRVFGFLHSLSMILAVAGPAVGGSERVDFPEGYAEKFTLYTKIDKAKKKKVRFMYVNRAGLADPSKPLPSGSILIMEDHPAVLDAGGSPKMGSGGRMIPTDKVKNIFVMEKRTGWGDAYPAETRNGDWEYAWFLPDGSPKPGKTMEKCFACHKSRSASDFLFTSDPLRAKVRAK